MEYLGNDKPINNISPLISVCVGTYNHEPYIEQCLNGILMQKTDFPFEILIGEDASSDNTRAICKKYAEDNPDRIRLFLRNPKDKLFINGKPSGKLNNVKTRNAARGRYIALCDGDDHWTDPLKLQQQVTFLENNPEYVLTFHDARLIDQNSRIISPKGLPKKLRKDGTGIDLIAGKWLPTLTVVFRNILPKQMPKEYFEVLNGDAFMYTLLGHHGGAKYIHGLKPAHYRKHLGGIWSALDQQNKYTQMLNTRKKILQIVSPEYKWAVKTQVYTNSILLSPYLNGIGNKLSQYFHSYNYFEPRTRFFSAFFTTHYLVAKKICRKIISPNP